MSRWPVVPEPWCVLDALLCPMTVPAFEKRNRSAFANFLRAKYETYTGAVTAASYPYYLTAPFVDYFDRTIRTEQTR